MGVIFASDSALAKKKKKERKKIDVILLNVSALEKKTH